MLVFLGSGVSVPSGLPSVDQVTQFVLGEDMGSGYPWAQRINAADISSRVAPESLDDVAFFLRILGDIDAEGRREMAPYLSHGRYRRTGAIYRDRTTYEDLYQMCSQIRWNGEGI